MIAKRIRRAGLYLVMLGVLFAQAAIAANACLTPSAMRAQAAVGAASSHCDLSADMDLNLCLYQSADQTNPSATAAVIAAPLTAALTVPDAAQSLLPWSTPIVLGYAAHDPPIPIRFCSFLI